MLFFWSSGVLVFLGSVWCHIRAVCSSAGCAHLYSSFSVTLILLKSSVACGSGAKQFIGHLNSLVQLLFCNLNLHSDCTSIRIFSGTSCSAADFKVNMSLALDATVAGGQATITLTGPSSVWFGVAFNAIAMGDLPYTIVVDGTGNVTEHKIGDHDAGNQLHPTQVCGHLYQASLTEWFFWMYLLFYPPLVGDSWPKPRCHRP